AKIIIAHIYEWSKVLAICFSVAAIISTAGSIPDKVNRKKVSPVFILNDADKLFSVNDITSPAIIIIKLHFII
ncbi:MAG: hypothetical protein ABI203_00020, partial [Mucilaginibacter sp.]